MNRWSCSGFEYPDEDLDRGKVLPTQEQMDAVEHYGRYRDVDGDGIPYRTIPGTGLDPLLYRGTGHDEDGNYSERPEVYHDLMMRLRRKIDGARDTLPAPLLEEEVELDVGIIHYGSMQNTIQEIDDILEATGRKVSPRPWRSPPLHSEVEAFVRRHDTIIVLEINRRVDAAGCRRRSYRSNWSRRCTASSLWTASAPGGTLRLVASSKCSRR